MSSLTHIDRLRLEKFLDMGAGYVSDFSDRTFRDFVVEVTGIDVYTTGYDAGGTSKANRLRTFWKKEDDSQTSKLIKELVEHQKVQKKHSSDGWNISDKGWSSHDEELYRECLDIVKKVAEAKGKELDDVGDEVKKGMLELLQNPQYTKRTFALFQKRFHGLREDVLRKELLNLGAVAFRDANGEELWGLRTLNTEENTSSAAVISTAHSKRITGEYVLRDAIIHNLLSKGYPEESLHPSWKQGKDEFNLVIIDPATKQILIAFLFELFNPNPVVISSATIREVIRKFSSINTGPQSHLYYITAMKDEMSFSISKVLTHTRHSDLPIFVKVNDLPDFKTFASPTSNSLSESHDEKQLKPISPSKPIAEFTDGELLVVIRQADNTNVAGSLYQRAYNEWQIRHQQKMIEAMKSHNGGGIMFEVGGNMTNHGVIQAGPNTHVGISVAGNYSSNDKTKIIQGAAGDSLLKSGHTSDSKPRLLERITNNQTFAVVVGGLILAATIYVIYQHFGVDLSQFK